MSSESFELSSHQIAWLDKIARLPSKQGVRLIERLAVDKETETACFDHLAFSWVSRDPSLPTLKSSEAKFDWTLELMFESPMMIEVVLEEYGETLEENEIDEISTTLLCRIGFLSSRFLDSSSKRTEEFGQLMAIVRMLLKRSYGQKVN